MAAAKWRQPKGRLKMVMREVAICRGVERILLLHSQARR